MVRILAIALVAWLVPGLSVAQQAPQSEGLADVPEDEHGPAIFDAIRSVAGPDADDPSTPRTGP